MLRYITRMKTKSPSSRQLLTDALMVDRDAWTPFLFYGLGYALLGLVVPLAVQLLVSNLAFAGLGEGLFTLSVLIGLGAALMQLFRLGQIYLLEYAERRLVAHWLPKMGPVTGKARAYFFEIALIPKVFSKWAIDGFEILLTIAVASVALTVYHPFYLVVVLGVWATLWGVHRLGSRGLVTALAESDCKYATWNRFAAGEQVDAHEWLSGRDQHFRILRRQILLLMVGQTLGTLVLLAGGAWLFAAGQLGLGQFVASELVGGGLFISLGRLGKFMETHYSLTTSLAKLNKAEATRG